MGYDSTISYQNQHSARRQCSCSEREHAVEVILLPGCLEVPHTLWNVRNGHLTSGDPAWYRVSLRPSTVISLSFSIVAQLRDASPFPSPYSEGSLPPRTPSLVASGSPTSREKTECLLKAYQLTFPRCPGPMRHSFAQRLHWLRTPSAKGDQGRCRCAQKASSSCVWGGPLFEHHSQKVQRDAFEDGAAHSIPLSLEYREGLIVTVSDRHDHPPSGA